MRNFDIMDVLQGTPEWLAIRAGRVTGSKADAVLAGKTTAARNNYILQLALERLKGTPEANEFSNRAMEHGTETEPLARIALEERWGAAVEETGFLVHKTLPIGVSLDGHIGDYETLIEIKCPNSTTHVGYLTANKLPAAYKAQVMHGLYITGAESTIFASFDDRMPEGLQLFSIECLAKDLPIVEYETELMAFLKDVEDKHQQLLELRKRNQHH